jgi:hypothetical protein
MARLDVRVDGRTKFSRTVDNAVVSAVLAAAVNEPRRTVKRDFGGKVVAEFDETTGKRKRAAKKESAEKAEAGDVPEKSLPTEFA